VQANPLFCLLRGGEHPPKKPAVPHPVGDSFSYRSGVRPLGPDRMSEVVTGSNNDPGGIVSSRQGAEGEPAGPTRGSRRPRTRARAHGSPGLTPPSPRRLCSRAPSRAPK